MPDFRPSPARRCVVRITLAALAYAAVLLPAAALGKSAGEPGAPVRVGVFDNPPIVFMDTSGRPAGIAVEFLNDVARKEAWKLEYVHASWDELLADLELGRIDLLTGIAYTEERAKRFRFTEQTVVNNWGIVYRNRSADISSFTDLEGKRVALMRGSIHTQVLRDLLERFDIAFAEVPVDSYAEALQAVSDGRADAGAINRVFGLLHAAEYQVIATPIIFNPVEVRYASPMASGNALVNAIDRQLALQKGNPDSAYMRALDSWLLSRQGRATTPAILWGAFIAALIIAAVAVANRYLQGQVRQRTAELRASERRYRDVVEDQSEFIVRWKPGGVRTFVNDSYCRYFGVTREQAVGTSFFPLIAQDFRKVVEAKIARLTPQTPVLTDAHCVVMPDGSERWQEWTDRALFDEAGNVVEYQSIGRDVTDQIVAERALRDSDERLRLALSAARVGTWHWDIATDKVEWSDNVESVLGLPPGSFAGTYGAYVELVHPDDLPMVESRIRQTLDDDVPYRIEHRIVRPDGTECWLAAQGEVRRDDEGRPVRLLGTVMDITGRRRAQDALRLSEERFSKAFHASPDAILISRLSDGRIIEVNEGFERSSGFSAADVVGRTTVDIGLWRADEDRARLLEQLQRDGSVRDVECELCRRSGEVRTCLVSAEAIEIAGEPCLLSVTRDITERKAQLDALEHQANHDSLTGLPNRNRLYAQLDAALREGSAGLALLLMDLNRFKEINDTLGHYAGDTILKQVAKRLSDSVDGSALVARLGGDEFAIMIRGLADEGQARARAETALATVRQPYALDGLNVEIGASIGIAFYPSHGDSVSSLMRCADVAMYLAKQQASGCAVYDAELDHHTPKRLALTTELGGAIRGNQLLLHYQPKIDVASKSVTGLEALVRWEHPTHGMIPPNQFIHLAEMSDLITPLTLWVVDTALQQQRAWERQGISTKVAVNLSTRNLLDQRFPGLIARRLEDLGVDPAVLEFEITESAMMADPERALSTLWRLHEMGLRLAIDDFGTGYSSLSYLRRLPIQALKIDISFVRNMIHSEHDSIIVNSTINLARNLGLEVVAEGVEGEETLQVLSEFRCNQAQGYHISPPLPADELTAWLRRAGGGLRAVKG